MNQIDAEKEKNKILKFKSEKNVKNLKTPETNNKYDILFKNYSEKFFQTYVKKPKTINKQVKDDLFLNKSYKKKFIFSPLFRYPSSPSLSSPSFQSNSPSLPPPSFQMLVEMLELDLEFIKLYEEENNLLKQQNLKLNMQLSEMSSEAISLHKIIKNLKENNNSFNKNNDEKNKNNNDNENDNNIDFLAYINSHATTHQNTKNFNEKIYQPINQPIIQPTMQPINQPIIQPTMQPLNQITSQPINRQVYQPTNQPNYHETSQLTNQPINQSTNQPTNQTFNQPTNQTFNQPTNQPLNQPTSHYLTRGGSFDYNYIHFSKLPDEQFRLSLKKYYEEKERLSQNKQHFLSEQNKKLLNEIDLLNKKLNIINFIKKISNENIEKRENENKSKKDKNDEEEDEKEDEEEEEEEEDDINEIILTQLCIYCSSLIGQTNQNGKSLLLKKKIEKLKEKMNKIIKNNNNLKNDLKSSTFQLQQLEADKTEAIIEKNNFKEQLEFCKNGLDDGLNEKKNKILGMSEREIRFKNLEIMNEQLIRELSSLKMDLNKKKFENETISSILNKLKQHLGDESFFQFTDALKINIVQARLEQSTLLWKLKKTNSQIISMEEEKNNEIVTLKNETNYLRIRIKNGQEDLNKKEEELEKITKEYNFIYDKLNKNIKIKDELEKRLKEEKKENNEKIKIIQNSYDSQLCELHSFYDFKLEKVAENASRYEQLVEQLKIQCNKLISQMENNLENGKES